MHIGEKVQDARLDTDIERRDGLVEDNEFRVDRECPRYTHTLALASRELVWKALKVLFVQLHQFDQLADAALPLAFREIKQAKRFGNDFANPHSWVQRCEGILKYDLKMPALLAHLVIAKL
ncbi:hypothetical protein X757_07960 [Mesorhizobium sp. LSHC414A00]|nr:hypothetical protein X757_07960 [Mesorhizobium sp. LSHC414A00]